MPMKESEIVHLIKQALPDAQVEITDLRGDGDHYAAVVTSAAFKGKTRVQQHKLVYDAFKTDAGEDGMGSTLHALALQTAVPDEE